MPASAACATESGPDDIVMYRPSAMMELIPAVMRTGVQNVRSSDIVGAEEALGLEDEHDHQHPEGDGIPQRRAEIAAHERLEHAEEEADHHDPFDVPVACHQHADERLQAEQQPHEGPRRGVEE